VKLCENGKVSVQIEIRECTEVWEEAKREEGGRVFQL